MPKSSVKTAPHGSWSSPIHSSLLTQKSVRLGEPALLGNDIFWLEYRPQEKGRSVLVRYRDNQQQDMIPPPFGVFSKAHEYGGGAYCLSDSTVYFVNAGDQQIYAASLDLQTSPQAVTAKSKRRFADLCLDLQRNRLICVCEDHTHQDAEPETTLVSIDLGSGAVSPLLQGNDFYSNPQLSPCGTKLSWLSWDHPFMPWDQSQCWIADLDYQGNPVHPNLITGGTLNNEHGESVFQPQWGPDGHLYFVSDRNNWWNIYRYRQSSMHTHIDSITCEDAEFATPQWVFGMSTYSFLNEEEILALATRNGQWQLVHINLLTKTLTPLDTPWTDLSSIRCNGHGDTVLMAASPSEASQIVSLKTSGTQLHSTQVIKSANAAEIDPDYISEPQAISFATGSGSNNAIAHAFFYPPCNPAFQGDGKPPLIVLCHGGPTGATETGLNIKIQYWTSRGFAVADVNYRGSTGYGRLYREQLNGNWGVSDVEDVCAVVKYLADNHQINPDQVTIKGSSAGGYTVLAALTFTDTFKAGASLYGIGNLETLALDTHKFEARYLDSLVGPYPEQQALYQQRSPIHNPEGLNCPVIFFQGLEDKVVPPNQAEAMVQVLKDKQVPVAYITFATEGHGFRQADSIQRSIEGELSFYAQIFGFEPADTIEPVEII
ncbi:MAG: S9 family peptidase [Candidatus Pelagadaptatus aseana]|uniref:S9 family peptidase n=1 Tax=Candidatus Pelagadaptatus aseana TaxID=3120508 RepID=UPI0039B19C8E